jgi:hypothetical protein
MKTFSTDGRIPLSVLPDDGDPADDGDCAGDGADRLSPEDRAWDADNAEATANAASRSRYASLPGRELVDLEAVSDLWLD